MTAPDPASSSELTARLASASVEISSRGHQLSDLRDNFASGIDVTITFLPGDIVLTGTPANSRPMNIGDVVEVEVTGVGRLTNTVAEAPAPTYEVGHLPMDTDAIRRVAFGGDWWAQRDAEAAELAAASKQ